ncbi:hypothetical protein Taro_013121 [Colocasia esculenta]|uniref:Uncharacterized protein n=1 Tax=Colocasia esculenta TaxID=4460 RepID=A0A843UEQ1_COLES|nr:hypothetical protein [Colocasia esculenta]
MVLQCADAGVREQHLRGQGWGSDGQRQGRGAAPAGAVQQYPLGRQLPGGVLSSSFDKAHNAGRGASSNLAGLSVEEALASIWALEDADGVLDGGVSLPLATPVVCQEADEGSLEIRRDQPHLQQWRSSGSAHGQPASGAVASENGTKGGLVPCSFAFAHPLNQRPLHQQHLQNYCGNVMATYPLANEQQRYGRIVGIEEGSFNGARSGVLSMDGSGNGSKAASSYCSGAFGFGGGDRGGGITGVGQTRAVSPKSSISSDGSGGDMVGNSPSAVWEVDMHRGASKGGGGSEGGGSGVGGRKRAPAAANEEVLEPWQPHMVRSASESPASLRDTEQSIDAIKQLFLCANMELESCLTVDEAEIRSKEEKVKQLLQLLRVTSLERDEARDQLQRLLSKMQANPLEQSPTQLHPDLLSTARARCGLDSPCRTHTYPPYVPSPMDSLVDAVSPPKLPHKAVAVPSYTTMAQQQAPHLPERTGSMPPPAAECDPASAIIDRLVLKRALPEKGKLMQAVMEAGPLLQTLLVAGSLPRWRNPPPLQPFQIPPVTVGGRESGILIQNADLSQNYLVQSSPRAFQSQNSPVASQIYSASSLDSSGLGASVLREATSPTCCAGSYQGPAGKRQKF